ncbi:unnamed protein product [Peronospora belbahrii]|uniref:Copper transporter n=1 Tax=Peronospora belbahrii TaxID=622444 RepID=A0AAU9L900_9STRA|nr:unnamed protein product [Peronospora belbahrii]
MNRYCSVLFVVLFAVIFAFYGALEPINAMDMDNMPEDPVSGKMVMTKAYNFELKNGQKLKFASQETLDMFLKDPKNGLKGVVSLSAVHDHSHDDKGDKSVLCPVCGMVSSLSSGPQVIMKHGEQAVHTCSMTHAREVYDDILSFQSSKEGGAAAAGKKTQGFCFGPGTTMQNGFSVARSSTPCILLWFPGWVLNTRMRYIFGGILVALVAIFNEYLVQLRRVLRKESSVKRLMSSNAPRTAESVQLLRSTTQSMPPSSIVWTNLVPQAVAGDATRCSFSAARRYALCRLYAHASVYDLRLYAATLGCFRLRCGALHFWRAPRSSSLQWRDGVYFFIGLPHLTSVFVSVHVTSNIMNDVYPTLGLLRRTTMEDLRYMYRAAPLL